MVHIFPVGPSPQPPSDTDEGTLKTVFDPLRECQGQVNLLEEDTDTVGSLLDGLGDEDFASDI